MDLNKLKDKKILTLLAIALVCIFFISLIKVVKAPEKEYIEPSKEEATVVEVEEVVEIKKDKKIIFVGDIMLSRQVNTKMEKYEDYSWPFRKISDKLNEADFVVANLESPFLKNSKNYRVSTGSFSFKANPLAVAGLNLANIKVISLANNHTINQAKQGIIDTIEILEENDIAYSGAGINEDQARKAAIVKNDDDVFAFLSYAYPQDYSLATKNRHGLAGMDIDKMINDITELKKDESIDLIAVLMHAGHEYVLEPNWQQKKFARAAIDAGADIVVGHHPHWPQIFEFYNEKPIIYSLGNFVFDQMWSLQTRQGLMLEMVWRDEIKELKLSPTKIFDYGQVELMEEGTEKINLLNKIKASEDGVIYKKNEE